MANALDLPIDVWIYVLDYFLQRKDGISLLKTCRAIYSSWSLNKELKEVVIQDNMFASSFDLDSMSPTECRRAVLAPQRMVSKIARRQIAVDEINSKIYPVTQRVLPLYLEQPILVMLLLPGGRYLVAKTKIEIIVVDTQSQGPPTEQMRQKNKEDPQLSSSIFLCGPSSDGSKVRIATIENLHIKHTTIAILEFDPQKRQLKRLASRRIDQERPNDVTSLHCDTLAGDLFCYFDSSTSLRVFAWNFVQDTFISWEVDGSMCGNNPLRKLVIDSVREVFIVFTDRNILFWELKRILETKTSGHIARFLPKWSKPFEIRLFSDPSSDAPLVARQLTFFFSLNIWYYTNYPLPGFDLILWDGRVDSTYSYTYEISYDSAGEPSIRLAQMHLIPQISGHGIGIKHNRVCDGKTILLWERYEDGRLFAIVKPTLVETEASSNTSLPLTHAYEYGAELVHSVIAEGDDNDHGLMESESFGASSFDPVSGRLCTTSLGGTGVIMSDYLGEYTQLAKVDRYLPFDRYQSSKGFITGHHPILLFCVGRKTNPL